MKKLVFLIIIIFLPIVSIAQGQLKPPTKTNKDVTNLNLISKPDGVINGHGYIDLGLPSGTKWATTNIGATDPYSFGNYYAWCEIETKKNYTSENSKTLKMEMKGNIIGNVSFDVASAKWGKEWQLPSDDDFSELRKDCKWDFKKIGGINGWVVTGPNGKSIFFPASGDKDVSIHDRGTNGRYWTGNLWDAKEKSTAFFFDNKNSWFIWGLRDNGFSVRAVSKTKKYFYYEK